MGNHYIHVGSITNAMRGRQILETNGIRSYLQRMTHGADREGCGYRLLVTKDVQRAQRILQEGGVRVIRISDAM